VLRVLHCVAVCCRTLNEQRHSVLQCVAACSRHTTERGTRACLMHTDARCSVHPRFECACLLPFRQLKLHLLLCLSIPLNRRVLSRVKQVASKVETRPSLTCSPSLCLFRSRSTHARPLSPPLPHTHTFPSSLPPFLPLALAREEYRQGRCEWEGVSKRG